MMNFVFRNPTKLIFGRGQIAKLHEEIAAFGSRVLLAYGGGSIKKNGVYDAVRAELDKAGASVFELAGVEPNPRLATVRRGVDICRREKVDVVLAVGGGSVIDCCKAVAAGAKFDGDPWAFISHKAPVEAALPLGTVLTLAATGSEMNNGSVITNWETQEKVGWGSDHVYPAFSILDPAYTASVPKDHTVNGIVDIMSHVFEQYFRHTENVDLQDRMCESVLRTVIDTAPKLVNDLGNYEYRETILYCGTIALNGFLSMGTGGDWATHNIEHAVSAVYDIPHGGGLAILFPNWMTYCLDAGLGKFRQMAVRVFDVPESFGSDEEIAREGIRRLRAFWSSIGAPSRLADYGIDDSQFGVMAGKAAENGPFGGYKKLDKADVEEIYALAK